jgi:hypothetical protein
MGNNLVGPIPQSLATLNLKFLYAANDHNDQRATI